MFFVLEGLNFLYNLKMTTKITRTKTVAKIGKNMDTTDITMEVPVSAAETNGLTKPPVVAVDVKRVAHDDPATAAAVPPPAIMAKDQVITGLKSATVESITAVPANAAIGTARLSNKLSI